MVIFLSGVISLLAITSALAYNEAPMLQALVDAGVLPPVEERLPNEPIVVEPFEEIGQYGGVINVFAINPNAWNDLQPGVADYMKLFRSTRDGTTIEPNIAKGYKWSEDRKTFTIYLRKGLRWSDGAPFTADDIVFTFEDVVGNDELTPVKPSVWTPGGKLLKAIKVDNYTVRLSFAVPYPSFELIIRTWRSFQTGAYNPKHYLKRWHIKYNPKADELAKEEGYENWWQAFNYHSQNFPQQEDINLPRMLPWVMKSKTTDTIVFERNPYYWKVDPAGNQLPYIDKMVSTIVDLEVYQLKVISGQADFAYTGLSLDNYPLYKENEDSGDYRVILEPGPNGSELGLSVNLNEKDPILRKIYQDIRFRQALSLSINRDEINEAVFFGKAVPRQATVLPTTSYYKKEWGEYFAQYDPDRANHLLDEIGLKHDKDGFRLLPDGRRLVLTVEYVELEGPETVTLEIVKEYWEAVGIKTVLKSQERTLFRVRYNSSEHGVNVWLFDVTDELLAFVISERYYPPGEEMSYAYDWGTWLLTNGKSGEEPPEDIKEYYNWWMEWKMTLPGSKEYMELAEKIFDFWGEQLWVIGTVGMVPTPYIAKNNLRNVADPKKDIAAGPTAYIRDFAEQLFFKR